MNFLSKGMLSFLTGFSLSLILLGCGEIIVDGPKVKEDGQVKPPLKSDVLVLLPDSGPLKVDNQVPRNDTQEPRSDVFVAKVNTVVVPAQKYLLKSTDKPDKPTWVDMGTDSILSYLKGSDGDQWSDGSNYVIYEVSLSPGMYYLYFTGRYGTAADGVLGVEGLNDSFFVSPDFGARPTTRMNAYDGDFENSAGENFLNSTLGMYKTIKKYQVLTEGVYRFMVGVREDGMVLSSLTFSTDANLK